MTEEREIDECQFDAGNTEAGDTKKGEIALQRDLFRALRFATRQKRQNAEHSGI